MNEKVKYTTDDFVGHVQVTISEKEVRVWVCDEKGCQFRFKAMGKVMKSGGDVMIIAENNFHDALLDACKELADIFPEHSIGELDAADFKDRANRIWTASQTAKNLIAKAEKEV